jgi:hypothetical protein
LVLEQVEKRERITEKGHVLITETEINTVLVPEIYLGASGSYFRREMGKEEQHHLSVHTLW